ncbi:eRF1 domain 3 family protein, putative [Babesia bigemina]|uniref:Protein pelota homolog n=1 Tax=Babesia bigemina TaxID=5866 RepID=A0A061D8A2_BABBI|nr:eRF1 domain 3 family protein, putative [Babesia bigemina]CDR96916.1 eRF1 domain 3 family protein, putative [Babesia bigemina]|eukprot:XP_012769102.1 eRF1 domain 3 family protein, putative [Babesia bigemina]
MQVHKRSRTPSGGIVLAVTAENPDDIWCIYNLLAEGDEIVVFTSRKVKRENVSSGAVSQEVKKFNIHLSIERITYASSDDDLQVSGKNISDNPYVKIGQYHTAEIRLHSKITLTKQVWNSYYADKLREATDLAGQAEQAFLVLDTGKASLFLVLRYLTKEAFTITHNIPNRKISDIRYSHHQKAEESFFKAVIQKLHDSINFEVTRTVIITGPGFTKTSFYEYLRDNLIRLGYNDLHRHLKSFVVCGSTSSDRRAIGEVLSNESFAERLCSHHYVEHNRAVEALRKRLEANDDTVAIGLEDVIRATELGAVETVLISEDLIRKGSTETRKRVHKFIEDAKNQGARAFYFSDEHFSSEFLRTLTGVAALLRFDIGEAPE